MNHIPLPNHAADLVRSLEDLNMRIARLSQYLGADIVSDDALDDIFERRIPQLKHQAEVSHIPMPPNERREHNDWEELRGLLILRCEIMTSFIDDFGIDTTKKLAEAAEAALAAHGFKPGVDGLRLFRLTPRKHAGN